MSLAVAIASHAGNAEAAYRELAGRLAPDADPREVLRVARRKVDRWRAADDDVDRLFAVAAAVGQAIDAGRTPTRAVAYLAEAAVRSDAADRAGRGSLEDAGVRSSIHQAVLAAGMGEWNHDGE